MSDWKVEGDTVLGFGANGYDIWYASVSAASSDLSHEEACRIARLMCAAPEMLEFIKEWILDYDFLHHEDVNKARAIIKKIEG